MIYLQLLLLALVVIFVVDLSGFTQAWRAIVAKALGVASLRPLPPFDCSLCMVWWVCLIFALCNGEATIPALAYIALLAYLSMPMANLLRALRELLLRLTDKLFA